MFDLQVPFFNPLWIRVLVVVFCLGWAGVELATGGVFWAILFGSMGVYAAYQFFVVWAPKDDEGDR